MRSTAQEGNFRYVHGRVRTFCESIVFYSGEDKERADCINLFGGVYDSVRYFTQSDPKLQWLSFT